jgi:hypothetical protein
MYACNHFIEWYLLFGIGLTPDFRGDAALISMVARSGLDVYAHNIEVFLVESLVPYLVILSADSRTVTTQSP